ncbi:GGDEF domain-containing protein [Congregibacter brevis]|uniref:diguanylate cyclase n=1 Tax=Congregibacter brevis TaxID=3081201 RepID=A0ABZ0IE02_9GAMM|nr:GGDEF domain-containing protein [Congregibacter sp. IMCC45268]
MIYLRNIPEDELFSAQLELLMQHGRVASMMANLIGAIAAMALLWPYFKTESLLLWGFGLMILLLLRSLYMSGALADRRYLRRPKRVFWQLILGSAVTGLVWSATYIYVGAYLPTTLQYLLLLIIVMIAAISLAVMVVVREYFLVFIFSALWPIAWWCLAHFWDQPNNLLLGVLLLALTGLLAAASNGIHETFRRMLSLNWQQEAMARELGQITNSLRDRNLQLQEARRQLTDLANIDELTGLGNRRLVNQTLREEVNRARRSHGWLSVVLIDVDFFKKYNDTYGHPAGDEVLRRIGDIMQRATARAGEVAARYGGEEFILVLPGARVADALRTAERLKLLVHEECIPHSASDVSDRISISQGVLSIMPDEDVDPGVLVDRADAALYEAKREGRDRIAVV